MKNLIIIVLLVLIAGCNSFNPKGEDLLPPLMNTNEFTNYVPLYMPYFSTNNVATTNN